MSLLLLSTRSIILAGCQGGHSEQLFFALFYQSTTSCLKVVGGVGWGGVVAHVIIVSAQSKELGFWVFLDLV